MRILITGDRNWSNDKLIVDTLTQIHREEGEGLVIIQGGARGADQIADDVARSLGIKSLTYKADWDKLGRAAGPVRNQRMLDEGQPDWVLAFHPNLVASRGTQDMVRRARKAGVPVTLCDDKGNWLNDAEVDKLLTLC